MAKLKFTDIAISRLVNQQIVETNFQSADKVVNWMGAVQAQDFAMSKLAVGLRFRNSTETEVNTALNNAEIIRTHLLRPTWHLVSPEDIYWMLELSVPKLKSLLKPRLKELELTQPILKKCFNILESTLFQNKSLTRKAIVNLFEKAKIKTDENRSSHILMQAEFDGLICSGLNVNNDTTYALLEERVPAKTKFNKDELSGKLAKKYFQSHSPATIDDFIWWSGLNVKEARKAMDSIKPGFISERIGESEFWYSNDNPSSDKIKKDIFLLPAYDEFIISYKNRDASLTSVEHKKAISVNGLFRPTVIQNGKVIGIWKRSIVKDKLEIEVELFNPQSVSTKNNIEKSALQLGVFWNKNMKLNFI
jgi:hypothetical protein